MIENEIQLHVSLEQLQRLIQALGGLRRDVMPKDPKLFGVLAEAPLDDMEHVRQEIDAYLHERSAAGPERLAVGSAT